MQFQECACKEVSFTNHTWMGGGDRAHLERVVELVQHQAEGASQVADIGGLLAEGVLEGFKVLHPLHSKAVVDDVCLRQEGRE